MKRGLLALVLIGLIAQTPTLSPFCLHAQQLQQQPGNPGHQPPPENFYCSTHATDPAKKCACHKVDTHAACEGEPVEDNAKCLVACFKQHCHCDVECRPGGDS